jgi:hypothetical protein
MDNGQLTLRRTQGKQLTLQRIRASNLWVITEHDVRTFFNRINNPDLIYWKTLIYQNPVLPEFY